MSQDDFPYQPGAMLHDAVMGAFRASGETLDGWCTENGVQPTSARNATFGMAKGPRGRALLKRLIEAAGSEVVRAGYLARVKAHAAELKKGAVR